MVACEPIPDGDNSGNFKQFNDDLEMSGLEETSARASSVTSTPHSEIE